MPRADRAQRFLMDPSAILEDPDFQRMGLEARAAYLTLVLKAWFQKHPGSFERPTQKLLAQLALCTPEEWGRIGAEVSTAFKVDNVTGDWSLPLMLSAYSEQDKKRNKWRKDKRRQRVSVVDIPVDVVVDVHSMSSVGSGSGSGTEKEEPKPKVADAPFVLPEWVPKDPFNGLVEARKKSRTPMTSRAKELLVAKLARLRGQGHDPTEMLDTATERGWRTVFAPTTNGHSKPDGWEITTERAICRDHSCRKPFERPKGSSLGLCPQCRQEAAK